MFDEISAKQLILRILQIPIPEQVSDQSLKFVILFFENKKKAFSSKTIKILECISPFSDFMQEIFGENVQQGNCSFSWSSLSIIEIKLKSRQLSENDIKAASLFVFYASFDWLTVFELKNKIRNDELNQTNPPFLPDTSLLDSILTVSSICKPFIQYSLALFCLIFNRISLIEPCSSVKILESSASKFLSSVTSTDSQTLHLINWASLINQTYEKQYKEKEHRSIEQPLRTVLELIMQAIQLVPKYFSTDDALTIYNILKPFAQDSCNDPFILNSATIIAPFLDVQETDQIFQTGVEVLIKHIISLQPFLKFEGLHIKFSKESENESYSSFTNDQNEQKKSLEIETKKNDSNSNEKCHFFIDRGQLKETQLFISEDDFTSPHELISRIPDDVRSIASLLKHTLEHSSKVGCEQFPSMLEPFLTDTNSDSIWSVLLVLLYVCESSQFEEPSLCEFFRFILSHTLLFDSRYSIFTNADEAGEGERMSLKLFLTLRFYCVRIFVSPSQISCFQIYWKSMSRGLFYGRFGSDFCSMLAEFFTFMSSIRLSSIFSSVIPICVSDTYLRSPRMIESPAVSESICKLIESVIRTDSKSREFGGDFFMNESFLDFVFVAAFDSFFSQAALRVVSHCFSRFAERILPRVAGAFSSTQEEASPESIVLNQDDFSNHISVLSTFLEMATEGLLHHSEKVALFVPLFQSSYRSMKRIASLCSEAKKTENKLGDGLHFTLCQILHNFVKFASLATFDDKDDLSWKRRKKSDTKTNAQPQQAFAMTQSALDSILTMIDSIEGAEPSTPCFSALVFAASGGRSASLRAEFFISRPSFLSLTIRAFSRSSRLSGVLKFISSLCDFSTANCRACSVGGIDLELVRIVVDNSCSGPIVRDAFKLFEQVAQSASSTAAVASFMTSFHCISQPYKLSPVMEAALLTLDQILARGSQTPSAFLPAMNELPCINVEGLTEFDLYAGFTVVAWVFIDGGSQDSPASIISIGRGDQQQANNSLLTVIVQLGRVFISNGRFLGGRDAIILDDSVPTDRWTMIAVTFENAQSDQRTKSCEFRIKSFICNRAGAASQRIPIDLSQSRSKQLSLTSCGPVKGGSSLEHPALVASVTLFPPLKSHDCLEIAQNGLLLTRSNTEGSAVSLETAKKLPQPFFCSVVESENSVLCVRNTLPKTPRAKKASLLGRTFVQTMPFADVFTRFFTASSLLPVFALLSLPSAQEENLSREERNRKLSALSIRVLFRALQMSPQASCREFVASGGFKVVSFLLSSIPECLTPDTFSQVAAFARESSSEEVRKSAADEIVFNEKLWRLADEKTLFFVIQQWIGLAYENQRGGAHSLQPTRGLSSYLGPTILFFWTKKASFEKASELKELLINSIIVRTGNSISREDADAFMMAAISNDKEVTLDMLYIMKQIALMANSLSSFSDTDFFALHSLLQLGSIEVTCSLVRFIVAVHGSHIRCSFTLSEHLSMAANLIEAKSEVNFTKEDFYQVNELIDSNPEVFPVCCAAIAATVNSSDQPQDNSRQAHAIDSVFASVMRTQRRLDVGHDWAFWPIYASLKCGGNCVSSTAKFVLKSASDLSDLFGQAVVSSATAGDVSGNACREILMQAGMELLLNRIGGKAQSKESSPKVSEDAYVGLCFYFIFFYGANTALSDLVKNEGVSSGIVDRDESLGKPPFSTFSSKTSACARLSIDSRSSWRDKELALQCVQVIVKRRIAKYASIAAFLLSYLLQALPEPSTTLLKEARTVAVFEEPFVSLLTFSIKRTGSPHLDRTLAFETLIEQFKPLASHAQSFADTCATRMNGLAKRFRDEGGRRPPPPSLDLKEVEASLEEERQLNRHLWRSMWRQMTFDCAPWRCCLSGSQPQRRWKRDETLCTQSFVPMKMKVNYKFDDHNEASLGRELGNMKLARQKNEESKRKKKEASLCPDLLDTGSFEDKVTKRQVKSEDDEESSISQSTSKSAKNTTFSEHTSKSFLFGFDTATRFFHSDASLSPVFSCRCQRVRVRRTRECVFKLFSDFIALQFKSKTVTIKICEVLKIFLRAPLHHPVGIEIIARRGTSFFLVFPEEVKNTEVAAAIQRQAPSPVQGQIQTVKSIEFFASHGITHDWCKGRVSNFEYLMSLNCYSGRSFSQLSMYPFLPWVLSDYESAELDLGSPASFRDLSLPVGKLGQKRLDSLRKRAREMREFGNDPFLYSSYAVSPLIVILWMMRVEPFTTLHIEMQSGKFDHAARQFASVEDTFRMVKSHLNDFRELIPEFFFSESFLVNENRFDLGVANENAVDDVSLPPWARKSALAFVYFNRKALESDHVSAHLNEWIDLIWGFKQRGHEAELADNTYDPAIYSDVWTGEALNDPERRSLVDQTMTHCGQIPDQLFTSPHPKKEVFGIRNNTSPHHSTLDDPLQLGGDSVLFGTVRLLPDSVGVKKFELVLLQSSGKFVDVVAAVGADSSCTVLSAQLLMKGLALDVEEATSFSLFSLDEIAFGTASGKVSIVDAKQSTLCSTVPHSGIVNCVAAAAPFVVSGGADTVISCSQKSDTNRLTRVHTMPAYSSEVVCTSASREFHVIASGTREGLVIVQSLEGSAVTCVIELKEGRTPSHIAVTRAWGFVAVCTAKGDANESEQEINVFTLCGELVGCLKTGARITKFLTWASRDGFDFIAASLDNGRIIAFEAFFADSGFTIVADSSQQSKSDSVCSLPAGFGCKGDEVVVLSYSIESGTFVAVTKSGRVSFITDFFIETDRIIHSEKSKK